MQWPGLWPIVAAIFLFVLAVVTDFLDGYIAKKKNLVTTFGKLMDPIADKFLILTAFFVFIPLHLVSGWMFFLIFLREIILTGFRLVAMTKGKILAAESAGKLKTAFQMITILFILFFILISRLPLADPWHTYRSQYLFPYGPSAIFVLMLVVVGLTLYSGVLYLWHNRRIIFLK